MTQDFLKAEDGIKKDLEVFLKGNQFAVKFCIDMIKTSHWLDDVMDGEKLTPEEITKGYIRIIFDIPFNPFFDAFKAQLVPMIINTMLCWQDSNVLDKGSVHDRHISYGLRSAGIQLIAFCAFLIGGNEWAAKVGPDIRRLLIEDMDEYLEEMKRRHGFIIP